MAEAASAARQTSESTRRRKIRWRKYLRAFHRDVGYFVVGLTVIYAVSGLAVNHIADWDPNFVNVERTIETGGPLTGTDTQIAANAAAAAGIEGLPEEVYRLSDTQVEVLFPQKSLHVYTDTGVIQLEGQEDRFFLRVANWLHLNRGKEAWTFIADAYAVLLLFLAFSGMFMLAGRKGLIGRGGLIVLAGIAVPVVYVVSSGGP